MLITLHNDFHNSRARVRPDAQGRISARALRRAEDRLCGIRGCCCGGIRGAQNPSLDYMYDGNGRTGATIGA